jgi:hypothetical protein
MIVCLSINIFRWVISNVKVPDGNGGERRIKNTKVGRATACVTDRVPSNCDALHAHAHNAHLTFSLFLCLFFSIQSRAVHSIVDPSDTTRSVNVGIFGLVVHKNVPKWLIIEEDTEAVAAREIKALREAGAHIIVALTHLTEGSDMKLVSMKKVVEAGGIDLVIGGVRNSNALFFSNAFFHSFIPFLFSLPITVFFSLPSTSTRIGCTSVVCTTPP